MFFKLYNFQKYRSPSNFHLQKNFNFPNFCYLLLDMRFMDFTESKHIHLFQRHLDRCCHSSSTRTSIKPKIYLTLTHVNFMSVSVTLIWIQNRPYGPMYFNVVWSPMQHSLCPQFVPNYQIANKNHFEPLKDFIIFSMKRQSWVIDYKLMILRTDILFIKFVEKFAYYFFLLWEKYMS